MKKFLLALAIVALLCVNAQAADITLKWDTQPDATGFRIYRSVDMGTTWTMVQEVGAVTQAIITGQPDTGLLLYRNEAVNANGQAIRYEAGAWYNGSWKPPIVPKSTGIN